MTNLSVNINKVATIRNARGGNTPDVLKFACDAEAFGAQGITVHPRPDERHIRYSDVYGLKPLITTEFNIEGNPCDKFIDLVQKVKPTQVTLVPDAPDAITSNAGWDVKNNYSFLAELVEHFTSYGIRTSIFVGTELENLEWAAKTGAVYRAVCFPLFRGQGKGDCPVCHRCPICQKFRYGSECRT